MNIKIEAERTLACLRFIYLRVGDTIIFQHCLLGGRGIL